MMNHKMKLASIERVLEIQPIDGADKIEAVRVLGYWTVTKKGEFQVGDLGVWHNPDTVVDTLNPVYSFLKKPRLCTARFRGQVSHGLFLPVRAFGLVGGHEGQDVSAEVKILKYEKPDGVIAGDVKGSFPFWIPTTDETNLRSSPALFAELWVCPDVELTLKLDGTSATYFDDAEGLHVCTRGVELKPAERSVHWRIARKHGMAEALRAAKEIHGRALVFQGEVYGPRVQKNLVGASEASFGLFNIYEQESAKFLAPSQVTALCRQLQIPQVPILHSGGPLSSLLGTEDPEEGLKRLVRYANAQVYPATKAKPQPTPAEGVVIRPLVPLSSRALGGKNLSGKVISELFELKHEG